MDDKKPTRILEAEHRIILQVIGRMVTLVAALKQNGDIEGGALLESVEFMRTFTDRCHHGKEERHLFPLLGRKGAPVTGYPLDALIRDHEETRAFIQELADATEAYLRGDSASKQALAESLRKLIEFYPNHIWKEDYLLFPMANRMLSPKQQRDLRQKFAIVDADIDRDAYQRFEQLARRLEDLRRNTAA